jgi:hypothetical protein
MSRQPCGCAALLSGRRFRRVRVECAGIVRGRVRTAVNGDPGPIKALYSHGDETSQCGAWAGVERGWAEVNARWDWVGAQFIPGESTLKQEIVMTSVTEEMAYAVFTERGQVRLVDRPDPHPMNVRVTAVFRREADGWKAVHRHGDYLVTKQR